MVNNVALWTEFEKMLEEKIRLVHVSMESCNTPESLYRMQGQLSILRRFQKLREEVNGQ